VGKPNKLIGIIASIGDGQLVFRTGDAEVLVETATLMYDPYGAVGSEPLAERWMPDELRLPDDAEVFFDRSLGGGYRFLAFSTGASIAGRSRMAGTGSVPPVRRLARRSSSSPARAFERPRLQ
jgi:hypothetical protein